ncbi:MULTISPECIES: helix-turn-helix domain-containing protein [Bacillus cereus group]|uniref:HTH cro/C1-type domain-containing protein n=1 Tax=Bacillus thuringiensis DB27 TaxID=1431339 RepID=W8YLP6_BACTU|nr:MULTISPECIES: helix-turn-helix transcriptional regulator [Bacillus cereus group]OTY57406.1 transcriptional regulator [Bacillus thuringiensis serovar graciosensis]MBG9633507.1 transcriptional regulator [Bacillus thuringiensis]MBG9669513.1 transcriptional regulator [Bacillus thuringiensis]MBG9937329.1 transcriptional regulator [Bacillus tropicus]MBH0355323.1 transcriptional regulator [Bacillus thuringiensis]
MYFKIKETRKKFGDTLQSLAKKINYDYSNLSKIERGVYTPSLDLLHKIATVYKIEINDLIVHSNVVNKKILDLEDMEISQNYTFILNKEEISKEELRFVIQTLKIMRQAIKNAQRTTFDE